MLLVDFNCTSFTSIYILIKKRLNIRHKDLGTDCRKIEEMLKLLIHSSYFRKFNTTVKRSKNHD